MRQLRDWLATQPGGVRTFEEYHRKSIALQPAQPENAAMLRLLGDLSGRFVDCYYQRPLSVSTSETAMSRLLYLTDLAITAATRAPVEKLTVLNELSLASLD